MSHVVNTVSASVTYVGRIFFSRDKVSLTSEIAVRRKDLLQMTAILELVNRCGYLCVHA